ncbi:hypothetical protein ETD86_26605 [Nonomuraea turkmeniaca]|uniref:Uncharacterized protein n=1 Tax=Nonomuraea turkmeniaca TaxID=103838 RepID=A0A5S4FC74_9ACTN|nr:hypothetical protein [Nonomuraea turkmeniaca]TMR15726.1 hypothetical protein ETD86_26605 [Nonomuraea turkmeniaca]
MGQAEEAQNDLRHVARSAGEDAPTGDRALTLLGRGALAADLNEVLKRTRDASPAEEHAGNSVRRPDRLTFRPGSVGNPGF